MSSFRGSKLDKSTSTLKFLIMKAQKKKKNVQLDQSGQKEKNFNLRLFNFILLVHGVL